MGLEPRELLIGQNPLFLSGWDLVTVVCIFVRSSTQRTYWLVKISLLFSFLYLSIGLSLLQRESILKKE